MKLKREERKQSNTCKDGGHLNIHLNRVRLEPASVWFSLSGPALLQIVTGRIRQQTLVLVAGAPVFSINEDQRGLGVMVNDVTD